MSDVFSDPFGSQSDTEYAQGRLPDRTYASRGFQINREASRDYGQPARFVYKVIDTTEETSLVREGEEWHVCESEAGRYHFKLLVAREAGAVKDLWVQRVPAEGTGDRVKPLLHLKRDAARRLIDLFKTLEHIPVTGDAPTVRVDDSLITDLFANPDSLQAVYREDPERFQRLIRDDAAARDVIAVAHRREQVATFRNFLEDDDFFDSHVSPGRGPESVWQSFFEVNPWMLGANLSGQLMTAWDSGRLEQVVVGSSVVGHGKRADALLRTSGRLRSLVFAEIKTHRTKLLGGDYRPGCWAPSTELAGGVAQAQGTVHRAVEAIGHRIREVAADGSEVPSSATLLVMPRNYLVVGTLSELFGESGGLHDDKARSFELYRRHLASPEIITFDELLARAEWLVDSA